MDFIVVFFRDILSGPLYIVTSIISGILFCSCIGYLAEQNNLKKAAKEKFNNSYATVANIDNSVNATASNLNNQSTMSQNAVNSTVQPPINQPVLPPSSNVSMGQSSIENINQPVNNGQGINNISS